MLTIRCKVRSTANMHMCIMAGPVTSKERSQHLPCRSQRVQRSRHVLLHFSLLMSFNRPKCIHSLSFCLQFPCPINEPIQLVLLCQDLQEVEDEWHIVGLPTNVLGMPPLEFGCLLVKGLLYPADPSRITCDPQQSACGFTLHSRQWGLVCLRCGFLRGPRMLHMLHVTCIRCATKCRNLRTGTRL